MSSVAEMYRQVCTADRFPSPEVTDPKQRRQRQASLKTALGYLAQSFDSTPEALALTEELEATYPVRMHAWFDDPAHWKSGTDGPPKPFSLSTVRNAIQNVGQFLRASRQWRELPPPPKVQRPDIPVRAWRDGMVDTSPYQHHRWMRGSGYALPLAQWPPKCRDLWEQYRHLKRNRMREVSFRRAVMLLERYLGYLGMTALDRVAKLPPGARTKLALREYRRDRELIYGPPVGASADDLFALASVEGFVAWHAWRAHDRQDAEVRGRPPSTPTQTGWCLTEAVSSLAFNLKRPESEALIEYRRVLDRPTKRHDKKAPYHSFTVEELDQVGLALIETARRVRERPNFVKFPGAWAAGRFQTGLMLMLLVRTPMRARNWCEALKDEHLRKVNGIWRWHFTGAELKISKRGQQVNVYDVPITGPLVVKLLEEYLEVWRPKFPHAAERREVFLNYRGGPLKPIALCDRFRLHVHRYTGKRFFTHLARTVFTSDAINHGVSRNLVALLLNDTPQTVDMRYNEVNPVLLEPSIPEAYDLLFGARADRTDATRNRALGSPGEFATNARILS